MSLQSSARVTASRPRIPVNVKRHYSPVRPPRIHTNSALQFMIELVNVMDIGTGSDKTQVGFVIFGNSAENLFYLNTYNSKANIVAFIKNIKYLSQVIHSH